MAKDGCHGDAPNRDSNFLDQNTGCLQEEDMDVPETVEDIMELLLSGLRDTVCMKG